MSVETLVNLIQNVGVPIAILAFLGVYFVKPLGGSDGVVASFFRQQAETGQRQTELMAEQRRLVERLSETIGAFGLAQRDHIAETSRYIVGATEFEASLFRVHSKLIAAAEIVVTDQNAKKLLSEADDIVRQALEQLKDR